MQKVNIAILALTILFFSCRKEEAINDCGRLREGIVQNDISKVKAAMAHFITALQSKVYSEANVNALCQQISSGCDVQVVPSCFDCIKTLPSQTEIRITVNNAGASIVKTIDLSYTPANKIVFHNMHD